jgi:superfamily I DNA/RNA helicase
VLVRDRKEAAAIRRALQRRGVPSVYLSDKDSVTESEEAADVLRWLSAVANPLDGAWRAPPSPPAPPGWNWPNWRACRRTNWRGKSGSNN